MYIYEAHYEDTKSSARVTRTIEINPYNGLDDDDLYFVEAAKRAVEIRREYLGVDLMSLELIAK